MVREVGKIGDHGPRARSTNYKPWPEDSQTPVPENNVLLKLYSSARAAKMLQIGGGCLQQHKLLGSKCWEGGFLLRPLPLACTFSLCPYVAFLLSAHSPGVYVSTFPLLIRTPVLPIGLSFDLSYLLKGHTSTHRHSGG